MLSSTLALRGRHGVSLLIAMTVASGWSRHSSTRVGAAAGFNMNPIEGLYLVALASVFALIPSGPGYAGTQDAAAIIGIIAMGGTHSLAVTYLLILRFVLAVPITLARPRAARRPLRRPRSCAPAPARRVICSATSHPVTVRAAPSHTWLTDRPRGELLRVRSARRAGAACRDHRRSATARSTTTRARTPTSPGCSARPGDYTLPADPARPAALLPDGRDVPRCSATATSPRAWRRP